MTRDEKILLDIKTIADDNLRREIVQLSRRVKKLTEQRDVWKENAQRYRKIILEQGKPRFL